MMRDRFHQGVDMNDEFLKELRTLFASGFTGTITPHVAQGCVKQYELSERRRPKPDQVELREASGDRVDSGRG